MVTSNFRVSHLRSSLAFLIFNLSIQAVALSTSVVILPLYIYPTTLSTWSTLTTSLSANPLLQVLAVINPANGPGSTAYPNSDYIPAIAALNAYPNVQPICYVHTLEATRPINDVLADIKACAKWATYLNADIHMDGIFFDEAPYTYSVDNAAYMTQVSSYARVLLGPGRNTIVFNPGHDINGGITDPTFFTIADYINVFENDYSAYSNATLQKIPVLQRAKSSVMIHGFNGTVDTQTAIVKNLKSGLVGGIFISTQTDYDAWSTLWAQFCKAMSA